jgi:hypothetical protein
MTTPCRSSSRRRADDTSLRAAASGAAQQQRRKRHTARDTCRCNKAQRRQRRSDTATEAIVLDIINRSAWCSSRGLGLRP